MGDATIEINSRFLFRFGETPFRPLSPESTDFDGSEFLRGTLLFKKASTLFPNIKLALLPAGPILTTMLYSARLLQQLGCNGELVVHIDFPTLLKRHLERMAESFPSAVVLAQTEQVTTGVFQRTSTNPLDFVDDQLQNPIYYCDPLDARRLWLEELLHKSQATSSLHLFGSSAQTLQWQFHTQGATRDSLWPQETLLRQGLIPWLSGLLTMNPTLPSEAPLARLLQSFHERPDAWHLVVATPATLIGIANELENGPDDLFNSPFMLRRKEMSEVSPPDEMALARLSQRCILEFATEPGFVVRHLFEKLQKADIPSSWREATGEATHLALEKCKQRYAEWTKTEINASQERDLFRFAQRLARETGTLRPRVFDLLLASQSVIDSNFAYELLVLCRDFPASPIDSSLPELHVPLSELVPGVTSLGIERFETLQQRRFQGGKLQNAKKRSTPAPNTGLPIDESKYADNSWVQGDHPYSCSFPEEDIFMEEFAFRYRAETRERIRAKEAMVHELTSTLCDGIDIRETVRQWHQEKIMVREEISMGKADIGSIVFVFAKRAEESSYQWVSYWLAEQHDKSDLMFFATPYADNIIGPGIAKSTFGGFAVIPLPNYLQNPWSHQFIQRIAKTPSEALLVSSAVATDNRSILYIAPEPPAPSLVSLLRRSGKSVIYIRIDELPPDKIRRLRTFHILAEAGVRQYADKYIRKDNL